MHLESRKATSKSALAARARMLHAKNLAWLEGFPLAVEDGSVLWISVPSQAPAEEIFVDGRHLSRATWTLNKLRGDLAPVLPRLADDPGAWLSSVEHRIELLKGAIHHGRPLPPAESLSQVISWVHAGDPARARTMLELAEEWSAGYLVLADRLAEQTARLTMLRLLQLAADHGKKRVEALASCLFDERAWDVSLELGARFCRQIRDAIATKPKKPLPEDFPGGRLGLDLAAWCQELAQKSRRTRQQALRLFELAAPVHRLGSWAAWWDQLRPLLREARDLVAYGAGSRRGLRARLDAHGESVPISLTVEDFFHALRRMTTEPPPGRLPALLRALEAVPAEAGDRTHIFLHWSSLGRGMGTSEARITTLLAGFERYLRRKPVPDALLLQPWGKTLGHGHVEDEILERELPRRTVLEAYDHLATVAAQHRGLDSTAAVKALELFLQAGDSALAARLFDSLVKGKRVETYASLHATKLALRLCRERPERFADVLKALTAQEDEAELPLSEWPDAVLEPLCSGELGDFVRESVITGQLARLMACGTKSMLIGAAGAGPLPRPALADGTGPDWIGRYPPELHPALRRLAAVLDDPEAEVGRWLGSDFPDSGKLQREIEAIEARLEQADEARRAALLKRLANLKERIAQPSAPGPGRLERLRARLDRAWGRAIFDRWERELDASLPAALGRLLGIEIDEVPSCLAEPRPLALLAAATKLQEKRRALAYRMFAVRCGPPPWDLRDAPQNRAFVGSLPRLDWSPWIDGVGTVTLEAPRRLHLALEDDPLEIFRMGAHFQTCLSPGAMNFYSVFANAADINKRVLYARDGDSKVVGRCLLALTATGGLVRFDAYCHDGSLGFDQICTDFATDLARRMGTELVSIGRVPTLVASDWYDDGVRDLGDRFPALEEGSPLRRRLAALDPGRLLGELRRALKPARLDESTLPMVLGLSELGERPELVVPLLRKVAECTMLPELSMVTAAALGVKAGAGDLVRRLLLDRVLDYLRPACLLGVWVDQRAVDVAMQLDPAGLLDLLRRTRPKSARHWIEETEGNRLEFAALALQALYRPAQAQALWRRLAFSQEVETDSDQRERAREALA